MRGLNVLRVIVFFLLVMPFALGATIHGKIFDYSLRLAENAIVKINTQTPQIFVASDGLYSFNVLPGDYTVVALLKDSNDEITYYLEENISVVSEGDFVRDLIMFPNTNIDELNLDADLAQIVNIDSQQNGNNVLLQVSKAFLLAVVIIALAFLSRSLWCKRCKTRNDSTKALVEDKDEIDDLFSFIQKNKRVTQKDIRKEFSFSEAKISLMLSELEHRGKIKKIKRGRGNIIIINEKE